METRSLWGGGAPPAAVCRLDLCAADGRPPARRQEWIAALAPSGAEGEAAPALHRIERVGDEVDHDLVDPLLVRLDGRYIPRVLAGHDDLTRLDLVGVELDHAVEQGGQPPQRGAHPRRKRPIPEPLAAPADPLA